MRSRNSGCVHAATVIGYFDHCVGAGRYIEGGSVRRELDGSGGNLQAPAFRHGIARIPRGVPTLVEFFGRTTAARLVGEGRSASLIVGNNVLAQIPDLNDFIAGVAILLASDGTATFEFPHLLRLLDGVQYDTIYHEHYSYFSFRTITTILEKHGLAVYDVEELPTHGGSLRVYAQHAGGPHPVGTRQRSFSSERRRADCTSRSATCNSRRT